MAVAPRHLAGQHGAHRAVHVADGALDPHRPWPSRARAAAAAISSWSSAPSRPWSWRSLFQMRRARGSAARRRAAVERSTPCAFQCSTASRMSSRSTRPIISSTVRKPSSRHDLAQLFGDEEEVVDHVLGLAGEALARSTGSCVATPDRAGVEMALAHHDAAGGDQRRGGEAELVGAQQRADGHVAAGAQAAVRLHGDAAAQAVQQQGLLGFGQADLPGRAGVGERGQRRGAGAALEAGDGHMVGAALATPAATVPTPTSATSFTEMRACGLTFFRSWISCARSSIE